MKAVSLPEPEGEFLIVGYLIERGYGLSPSHPEPSHDVMDRTWHWRGFERCLAEPPLRNHLNALMNDFAPPERVIWTIVETPSTLLNEGTPYSGLSTLDRVKETVDAATSDQWVSVMCGVKFQREQCLRFSEPEILREFSGVLVQAAEIAEFVESVIPKQ